MVRHLPSEVDRHDLLDQLVLFAQRGGLFSDKSLELSSVVARLGIDPRLPAARCGEDGNAQL